MVSVDIFAMGRAAAVFVALAVLAVLTGGCSSSGDAIDSIGGFRVTILDGVDLGTPDQPLPFSTKPMDLDIRIQPLGPDGKLNPGFDGWVVVDVRPTGKLDRSDPLVVHVTGEETTATVRFKAAFGPVRLVAVEEGYVPDDRIAGAVCNNGKIVDGEWVGDDDDDGYVDFPADRGCFHPTDSDEGGGSGAAGASEPIYFANPTIGDVQQPHSLGTAKDESALRGVRVDIDRGFMVVVRVGIDGLYVTDFDGIAWDGNRFLIDSVKLSYRSIFAFNFSTPMNLQEGDCLTTLSGTVEEFYGFTELGKPTWKKGDQVFCNNLAFRASEGQLTDCAPPQDGEDQDALQDRQNRCRVELEELANTPFPVTRMVIDEDGEQRSVWDQRFQQTERFESALVQISDAEISDVPEVEVFSELRECDRNDNGIIDYYDKEESDCADECGKKEGCVVAETYRRFNQWAITFIDGLGVTRELAVVTAGAIPKFNPINAQGKKLDKIVGTLRNLAFGEPPWILEPRRPADCPDCVSD